MLSISYWILKGKLLILTIEYGVISSYVFLNSFFCYVEDPLFVWSLSFYIYLIICLGCVFIWMYVYVCMQAWKSLQKSRKGCQNWIPWICRCLWTMMWWVLGIELRYSTGQQMLSKAELSASSWRFLFCFVFNHVTNTLMYPCISVVIMGLHLFLILIQCITWNDLVCWTTFAFLE